MASVLVVSAILKDLQDILRKYDVDPKALTLVPSVQDWAHSVGLPENNPFRIARAARGLRGEDIIAFKETLSQDQIDSALSASWFRHGISRSDCDWIGADPIRFAKHTLLHEIAHLQELREEAEADQWALKQLKDLEEP